MSGIPQVIRENEAYWESLAPHRHGAPVEAIRNRSVIDDRELEVLGEIAGKRIVQLAAAVGDEALQLALMGASVTAVDIAPSHVATGRAKATELGVPVDFRVGDMTDLPADLRDVDVFYVSWGGVCWVPNLQSWLGDLATRLRPGGRVVLAEHHPLWEVLSVTAPDSLTVNSSYFDPTWHKASDIDKEPEIVKQIGRPGQTRATSFVWNLGEVVSGFLAAGLRVVHLHEYAEPKIYNGFNDAEHIPAIYITAATLPPAPMPRS